MPANKCLIYAAYHQQVRLIAFLVCEGFLCEVVEHVQAQHSGNYRDKGILLELILEDRCLGFSIWAHSIPLLRILDCSVDHSFQGSHCH